mmetsp:Transcript_12392/g.30373  ORF Transcript_12392/g.30373 Transcript_12392/m.30373 type:complete len:200 (-) Transcript_12392:184-783(-)
MSLPSAEGMYVRICWWYSSALTLRVEPVTKPWLPPARLALSPASDSSRPAEACSALSSHAALCAGPCDAACCCSPCPGCSCSLSPFSRSIIASGSTVPPPLITASACAEAGTGGAGAPVCPVGLTRSQKLSSCVGLPSASCCTGTLLAASLCRTPACTDSWCRCSAASIPSACSSDCASSLFSTATRGSAASAVGCARR